ncbi:MAG: hypothetical protein JWQ74_3443 [Marmoricola sp.]|nr:hypothetical protein [Marmoricola sp.]
MFRTLFRRTTLVAVVAVATTSLVSGGVVAATTPATTQASTLSIRAASAVKPGGTATVAGALRARAGKALPGKTVTLQAKLAGDTAFVPVATSTSGTHGGVSATVTPAETTKYRWVFAGDTTTRSSHSGTATVKVRQAAHPATRLATSLSIRVARAQVSVTGTDTVSGRLVAHKKALKGKTVVLLSRAKGATSWAFAGTKRTSAKGSVAFVVRPKVARQFKLVFQGTANFKAARSGVVNVAVRSTALTISTSSTEVGGVLTKSGTPYAGQTVQLRARAKGATKFTTVGSATTGADGSVGFAVAPATTTRYFLYFPKTADAPAAQSVTRTISVS